jgi:4-hydroxymandelate synthase
MTACGIEYLEFFTRDLEVTVGFLTQSFGLTPVESLATTDRQSTLLRQAGMRLLVTAGPATQQYLEAHGDGIAIIAISCDDVAATRAAATAACAQLRGDVVVPPGHGDMGYRLLPQAPATAMPSEDAQARIRCVDHLAVCVEAASMGSAERFYADAFGLQRYSGEYVAIGEQAMDSVVVRSPSGGLTLTLLEPDPSRKPGQIDAFLERNGGPGIQHVAFLIDDIVGAVRAYRETGIEFLPTPGSYYDVLVSRVGQMAESVDDLRDTNVLADRDEWGYLLQIFTRSPCPRDTLFFELIPRHGARGFGSANIRALYEAVEREARREVK